MRKQDYVSLAKVIRMQMEIGQEMKDNPIYAGAIENTASIIARQFADLASVNRTEFLKACGIP